MKANVYSRLTSCVLSKSSNYCALLNLNSLFCTFNNSNIFEIALSGNLIRFGSLLTFPFEAENIAHTCSAKGICAARPSYLRSFYVCSVDTNDC